MSLPELVEVVVFSSPAVMGRPKGVKKGYPGRNDPGTLTLMYHREYGNLNTSTRESARRPRVKALRLGFTSRGLVRQDLTLTLAYSHSYCRYFKVCSS